MEKIKILITGSSGMLGNDLCQELDKKYSIFGIDLVQGAMSDITDRKSISDIVKKIKPDVVIHLAAWTDVDGCELDRKRAYRINSDGTKNVALAAKEAGAILIYISTDFVFDGKKRRPYKENDRTNPISIYGDSKLKGEKAVGEALKKYYILRTSWLYGKHGKNFVDTVILKAKAGKALRVVDDQVGSPTYTKDLAGAIHALIDKVTSHKSQVTSYGTYHVSNSGSVSWYDYAKEILRLAGSKTKVIPISSKELARPAKRPAFSVLDNTRFNIFTGYKMRNWKEALKDYVRSTEK